MNKEINEPVEENKDFVETSIEKNEKQPDPLVKNFMKTFESAKIKSSKFSVNLNDISDNIIMSSGNQTIVGIKTFSQNISGDISGKVNICGSLEAGMVYVCKQKISS